MSIARIITITALVISLLLPMQVFAADDIVSQGSISVDDGKVLIDSQDFTTMNNKFTEQLDALNTDITTRMISLESSMNSRLRDTETRLNNQLDSLDLSVNTRLELLDSSVAEKLSNLDNNVSSQMSSVNTNINNNLTNLNTSVTNSLNELNSDVTTDVTNIYNQTDTSLNLLRQDMNTRVDTIAQNFNTTLNDYKTELTQQINTFRNSIDTKADNFDSEFQSAIDDLRATTDSKLSTLESEINTQITNQNNLISSNISNFQTRVDTLVSDFTADTDSRIATFTTTINESITALEDEVHTNLESQNADVSAKLTALKNHVDLSDKELSDKIDEINRQVSTGKGLIADAITGSNTDISVPIDSDASFQQMADAINELRSMLIVPEYVSGYGAVTAYGYVGNYDTKPHHSEVRIAIDGATVKFGTSEDNCNSETIADHTDVGVYKDYYDVYDKNGDLLTSGEVRCVILQGMQDLRISSAGTSVCWTVHNTSFDITKNLSGGAITLSSDHPETATPTLSGNTVNIAVDLPGTATITVASAETHNYFAGEVTFFITVTKDTGVMTLSKLSDSLYIEDETDLKVLKYTHTPYVMTESGSGATATKDGDTYHIVSTVTGTKYLTFVSPADDYYTEATTVYTIFNSKEDGKLKLNKTSDDIKTETTSVLKVTEYTGGGYSITNSNPSAVSYVDNHAGTITFTGDHEGKAEITVTSNETNRYKPQSMTFTLNVTKRTGYINTSANSVSGKCLGSSAFSISDSSDTVSIVSSNTSIVTYTRSNSNVNLSFNYSGSAELTLSCPANNRYYAATKVIPVVVTKNNGYVTLNTYAATIYVNDTTSFKVATYSHGYSVTNSNSSVVSYTKSGDTYTITAKSAGSAVITVKVPETDYISAAQATFACAVSRRTGYVNLSSTSATIDWGSSTSTTVNSYSGSSFSISPTSVSGCSYSKSGNTYTFTPSKAGSYVFTISTPQSVEYNAAEKTFVLTVREYDGYINCNVTSVNIGPTQQQTITVNSYSGTSYSVSSSKTSVATVSKSGSYIYVTGVNPGSCNITITTPANAPYKSATKTIPVNIVRVTPTLSVSPKPTSLSAGGSAQYLTVSTNSSGSISVSSSSTSVATASYNSSTKQITLTPVGKGTTWITVSLASSGQYDAKEIEWSITIAGKVPNLEVSSAPEQLAPGETNTFNITIDSGYNGTLSTKVYGDSGALSGFVTASVSRVSGSSTATVTVKGVSGSSGYITITAPATTSYEADSIDVQITVVKPVGYVNLSTTSPKVTGTSGSFYVTSHSGTSLSLSYDTNALTCTLSGTTINFTIKNIGEHAICVTTNETSSYSSASAIATVKATGTASLLTDTSGKDWRFRYYNSNSVYHTASSENAKTAKPNPFVFPNTVKGRYYALRFPFNNSDKYGTPAMKLNQSGGITVDADVIAGPLYYTYSQNRTDDNYRVLGTETKSGITYIIKAKNTSVSVTIPSGVFSTATEYDKGNKFWLAPISDLGFNITGSLPRTATTTSLKSGHVYVISTKQSPDGFPKSYPKCVIVSPGTGNENRVDQVNINDVNNHCEFSIYVYIICCTGDTTINVNAIDLGESGDVAIDQTFNTVTEVTAKTIAKNTNYTWSVNRNRYYLIAFHADNKASGGPVLSKMTLSGAEYVTGMELGGTNAVITSGTSGYQWGIYKATSSSLTVSNGGTVGCYVKFYEFSTDLDHVNLDPQQALFDKSFSIKAGYFYVILHRDALSYFAKFADGKYSIVGSTSDKVIISQNSDRKCRVLYALKDATITLQNSSANAVCFRLGTPK